MPVPWDPGHVFYVWYDALINYATAIGYGSDPERFAAWWPAVHHLIGKDILRFHCVYWPALLMAAGIDPPARIAVHGFLLVGGEKMSKSALTGIAPADLTPTFGVDGFRYHFLRDQAFGPDGDFSYEGMVARYNADLANNLGNLLARVATVVERKCGGVGPAPDPSSPLAVAAASAYETAAGAWTRIAPERGPRGHLAPGARDQRRPRSGRAVEGRARSGRRRRARRRPRGAADRGHPGQPGAVAGLPGDLAPHRSARPGRGPAPAGGRRLGRVSRAG